MNPAVVQIRTNLRTLLKTNELTFYWIRGHSGHQGNERADFLAKIDSKNQKAITYDRLLSLYKLKLTEYYKNV